MKADKCKLIRVSSEVHAKLAAYYYSKKVDGLKGSLRLLMDKAILNFLMNKK